MRSIWCGHLKIVMHGASMQSWRDLCVKLIEPGLYLSLQLHNLHWICQSYCGRYFSNYSFGWMFHLVCIFAISSQMSTLIALLTNHLNMFVKFFTHLNYQNSWIYFAPWFSSFDSFSFLHSSFSSVLLELSIFLSSHRFRVNRINLFRFIMW